MKRNYGLLVLVALFLFVFNGCASMSKKKTSELETKVNSLEERIQKVEDDQEQLQDIISQQREIQKEVLSKSESENKSEVKEETAKSYSEKDIQTALKNAGFYDGVIDGKIGPKTRNAIMEFQKKNDLKVDGVIGKNTWEILSKYLSEEKK